VRPPVSVLYLSIDPFLPLDGKPAPGLDEFSAKLEYEGVPVIWVSSRDRFQLDSARRSLAQNHPFIAEGGCAVYVPEGYFNVRPEKTIRLGRFISIPIAEPQPAAAEALEALSQETGVETVPLRSLSSRELAQNTGLPSKEAELLRHRDFDELFFFAAGEDEIKRFASKAKEGRIALRKTDSFWSLACGAELRLCVSEADKLYRRALRSRPGSIAIAPAGDELLDCSDRRVELTVERPDRDALRDQAPAQKIFLRDPHLWDSLANIVLRKGR
jgi:predicted mannosyl-3-phosphoglycerate phosphatase (HAD superfamily)